MSTMARAEIIGRAGSDPEMRTTASGKPMTTVSLAIDQFSGDGNKTTGWWRIVAFGGLAERLNKFISKGDLVHVGGRMNQRTWTDKEDRKQVSYEIICSDLTLITPRREDAPQAVAATGEAPPEMPE